MAYGHSSGLPPWEAPVMIAEKRNVFFSFFLCCSAQLNKGSAATLFSITLHKQGLRKTQAHAAGFKGMYASLKSYLIECDAALVQQFLAQLFHLYSGVEHQLIQFRVICHHPGNSLHPLPALHR